MKQAIVDSHIHFWDPKGLRYPWLAGAPTINKRYLVADLLEAASGVDLQRIVFVEADCHPDDAVAEAEWVAALAGVEPRIQGIVASAALEKGASVRPQLEALARIPLVKGIRRLIQGNGIGFCTQPDFVEAVQMLPEFGFSFDICIFDPQLGDAIQLVEQSPGVTFILDHFGKPSVKEKLLDPWREELHTLAAFPNVYCKISGLATEADHKNWSREQLRPYIDHAIDAFGINRVVYGGDWPVSTLAIGYQEWIDTITWATAHLDEGARRKLFVENAVRFYRLDE